MPQLNIRVPQDLLDRIRSQASRERVTVSELVRRAFPEPKASVLGIEFKDCEALPRGSAWVGHPGKPGVLVQNLSLGPPPSKPGSRLKSPKVKK